MATQLSIYCGALRECKQRQLATLTDVTKGRFLLDGVWGDGGATNGAILGCLEAGFWTFATRLTEVGFDPDYQWQFGYQYRFSLPPDFVRTSAVYQDEFGNVPLTQYREENNFIFANVDTIFLGYVSNDIQYGRDLANWPESFNTFVELYCADKIVADLTKSKTIADDIAKRLMFAGRNARSKSAQEQPTKFFPQGSFVRARGGSWPGSGRSRYEGQ